MPRSIPLRVETSPTVAKRWSPDGLTTCRSFYLAFRLFGCSKMGGGLYFVEDVACHITVTVVWLKRNMRVHSGCSAYSHKREPSRLSESNMTALYEKMCFFFWGGGALNQGFATHRALALPLPGSCLWEEPRRLGLGAGPRSWRSSWAGIAVVQVHHHLKHPLLGRPRNTYTRQSPP